MRKISRFKPHHQLYCRHKCLSREQAFDDNLWNVAAVEIIRAIIIHTQRDKCHQFNLIFFLTLE